MMYQFEVMVGASPDSATVNSAPFAPYSTLPEAVKSEEAEVKLMSRLPPSAGSAEHPPMTDQRVLTCSLIAGIPWVRGLHFEYVCACVCDIVDTRTSTGSNDFVESSIVCKKTKFQRPKRNAVVLQDEAHWRDDVRTR